MKVILHTQFNLLKPDLNRKVCDKQASQAADHDYHLQERTFEMDQKVMARDFRPGSHTG